MNPPKEVGLMRKLVSTARSVTTKQVALPLGILRLMKNLAWLEHYDIRPLLPEELAIIKITMAVSESCHWNKKETTGHPNY